jgi:hypothetical protein
MNENLQSVNNINSRDNFQLVTSRNHLSNGILPFLAFAALLILCAVLVYFLRSRKEKILPGEDFEIIE